MRFILFVAFFAGLGACVSTIQEVPGSLVVNGQAYETVTRTFQRDNGSTYARTTVIVGAQRVSCPPNDVRSCRAAVNEVVWRTDRF